MISAIVLAKNEEKNIASCLKSLYWCDQILLIDDYSSDKTRLIAKKYQAKIYKRHLAGDFSRQRNFALTKVNKGWVFFVDADEIVSPALAKEIKEKLTPKTNIAGFYLKRKDSFLGQWLNHGETAKVRLLRLAKKNKGKWQGKVHEKWQVKGKIGSLKNPLLHFKNTSLDDFLTKINYYSSLRAKELAKQRAKTNIFLVFAYPLGKFGQNYFLRLGFLDGMPGFIMAFMMSLHSFLVRLKLYFFKK